MTPRVSSSMELHSYVSNNSNINNAHTNNNAHNNNTINNNNNNINNINNEYENLEYLSMNPSKYTYIVQQERNNNNKRRMFSGEENDSDGNIENTLILPLMGRRSLTGRDKWQYYTISNTGSLNTKLPVRVRGKTCSSEYGCDEMMDGDVVHVDGYNHKFKATVYDNATFSYIPVL